MLILVRQVNHQIWELKTDQMCHCLKKKCWTVFVLWFFLADIDELPLSFQLYPDGQKAVMLCHSLSMGVLTMMTFHGSKVTYRSQPHIQTLRISGQWLTTWEDLLVPAMWHFTSAPDWKTIWLRKLGTVPPSGPQETTVFIEWMLSVLQVRSSLIVSLLCLHP